MALNREQKRMLKKQGELGEDGEPTAEQIVPSVFQEGVAEAVAAAVRALAPSTR